MLEGDVCLGADVHHLGVGAGVGRFGARGTAEHLNHDWLLGSAEGLHRLVMGGFGQVLPVDLNRHRNTRRRGLVFDRAGCLLVLCLW